jgi:hypothetical protein
MMMTTVDPIRGRTLDDGRERPAIYMLYNYTMGEYLACNLLSEKGEILQLKEVAIMV